MTQDSSPVAGAPDQVDAPLTPKFVGEIVRDLLTPDPRIYWTDLLLTTVAADVALVTYLFSPSLVWQIVGYFVAGLTFYRGTIFLHELQHLREGTFRGFKTAWNLLIGIPLLAPQYTYAEHKGHHRNRDYGTRGDAEYLQLVHEPIYSLLYMASRIFWLPLVFFSRYAFLTPLAWLFPAVRRWVWRHASTIGGINLAHARELPSPEEEPYWKLQEFGCCCYTWLILGTILAGWLPAIVLGKLLLMGVLTVAVSHTRTMTSHRFINDGREMTYVEQMLDSTTIPGHPLLTELWCPVGMRYHALHHLVPSIPYHNMAKAHRRLMERLPANSPYHETLRSGLFAALADIWHTVRTVRTQTNGI